MVNNLVIIGASSELAISFNKIINSKKYNIYNISRNNKYSEIKLVDYISDTQKIYNFIKKIENPTVLFFNGYLSENRPSKHPSSDEMIDTFNINFVTPFCLTQELSSNKNIAKFVYVSSIAAIKYRNKNYIYGSTKKLLEISVPKIKEINYLFLRFGKIKTRMSKNHKDIIYSLETETAAKLIIKNIDKDGIVYPKFGLKIISFVIFLFPVKFLDFLEKQVSN